MRIAVTGGSGFVGQHVLAELNACGQQYVATCRSSSKRALSGPNMRWVEWDIAEPSDTVFEKLGRPEVLIHLAWSGLPNYLLPHHVDDELPKQIRFLSGMVRQGLKSLVVAGTCFEYGMQTGPISASAPRHPENPYGIAKDRLFRELTALGEQVPFNLTWARLFYMFGEGQSPKSLFSLLRQAVSEGRKTFPMSGGEQIRDYLPVSEVARQLVKHALSPANRGAVNICSGIPISVRKLVEGWLSEYNWDIELRFGELPYPDYEPMAFWGVKDMPS